MELIRRVNIRYFRSIYSESITGCKSLNVISGQNDAGKSNVIKALNLYFNRETDWGEQFDFYRDFSVKRLQQVRKESVKGRQFVSVMVEFTRPANYAGSLPKTFSVTRTWFRHSGPYQESNNLETLYDRKLLPSTLETARRILSLFLNRIHFEYVPAVKDRAYYSDLLWRLQTGVLTRPIDSSAAPLVGNLASHIQDQVGQLQKDFLRATGLTTSIEPPQELASLFQSFPISTTSAGGPIPLVQRGDGIQARYVPSVLSYISQSSNDFFVWGFEEPENSLEYTHINNLANDFDQTYSKHAQIFITSHSPAFISCQNPNSACYRAFKHDDATSVVCVWPKRDSSGHTEALYGEIGMLKIQQEIHDSYSDKLKELEEISTQKSILESELAQHNMPLLLVEGTHDKDIIEAAWQKLFPQTAPTFIVRTADTASGTRGGGAGGATSVANMIEALHPAEGRKAIGLFDYDHEGIRCFQGLSRNFDIFKKNANIKAHRNGLSFAMLLPAPDFRGDYVAAENLPLEYLFTDNVPAMKTKDGRGLEFSSPQLHIRVGQQRINIDEKAIKQLQSSLSGYKVISSGKDVFAKEIVPNLPPVEFKAFEALFIQILSVL